MRVIAAAAYLISGEANRTTSPRQPLPDLACRCALLSNARNDADITSSCTAVVRASR